MKLEDEIQQMTFPNARTKAGINILFTASWFSTNLIRILKPFEMSWQQFNIMRILKGQKGQPASVKLISGRMIDKMSNTSRLVHKLVNKGYVVRNVCPRDRRKVEIDLTDTGTSMLEKASQSVESEMQLLMGHMTEQDLGLLNEMLDHARACQNGHAIPGDKTTH